MRNRVFHKILGLILWLSASGTGCQTGAPMQELSDLDDHESEPTAQVLTKDEATPADESSHSRRLGALLGTFFGGAAH